MLVERGNRLSGKRCHAGRTPSAATTIGRAEGDGNVAGTLQCLANVLCEAVEAHRSYDTDQHLATFPPRYRMQLVYHGV
jgi:hypothetical protein